MEITNETKNKILHVHNSLWNALYDLDSSYHSLDYEGLEFEIYFPAARGYASVLLPNPQGTKFLWITQNLNKSTYGSYQIQQAKTKDLDLRITWIVDNRNGSFTYRTNIKTLTDVDGNLLDGHIEMYDSLGTEIVWSTNPSTQPRKAKF